MARFNLRAGAINTTTNFAGGVAYAESPELEFASVLLTSFLNDQYYRTAAEGIERVRSLMAAIEDKRFLAKAALFARERGMRSITHLVAAELARTVKGEAWQRRFLSALVQRPDDATEILACY